MRTRTREIAKAGIFGSKDDPQIVTERDLKEIEETFADVKKAPVVFGHYPRPEDPRPGNVVSIAYDAATQSLSADIEEDDALADAVDSGYYPDVSIRAKQRATDGKMYLVHLAYLGQEAPAIKDLAASVKESLGIAASEASGARAFPPPSERRLYLSESPPDKNFLTRNMEEPPGTGNGPQSGPEEGSGAAGTGGNSAGGASPPHQSEEVSHMTKEEEQALREENERLKADARAKDLALSEAASKQREAAREQLRAAMDGKVPKGLQGKVLELSGAFDGGKSIELADDSAPDGKRKTSGVELLLEIISALPRPVEPGALSLSEAPSAAASSGKPDAATRRKMLTAV
jgi:hypothetical protein